MPFFEGPEKYKIAKEIGASHFKKYAKNYHNKFITFTNNSELGFSESELDLYQEVLENFGNSHYARLPFELF